MNNLKNHVVSYELSKQLYDLYKEKGREVPKSNFYWKKNKNEKVIVDRGTTIGCYSVEDKSPCYPIAPAYLSSELGEILPDGLDYIITTVKVSDKWMCLCEHIDGVLRKVTNREFAETESDARCKMLIYLLENNLI